MSSQKKKNESNLRLRQKIRLCKLSVQGRPLHGRETGKLFYGVWNETILYFIFINIGTMSKKKKEQEVAHENVNSPGYRIGFNELYWKMNKIRDI